MKLDHLEQLAKAATPGPWEIDWYVCRENGKELWRVPKSIGPISPDENHWARDHIGTNAKDTAFIAAANPAVILELIALVRLQHEALEKAREDIADWGSYASDYFQQKWDLNGDIKAAEEALAAYDRLEGGE